MTSNLAEIRKAHIGAGHGRIASLVRQKRRRDRQKFLSPLLEVSFLVQTEQLLSLLNPETKIRLERVRNWLGPIPLSSEEFLVKLREAESNAFVADGRAGWVGNPYEQIYADISRIHSEVKEILGIET